ncbi:MAG: hypothetical protein CMM25_02820 [Rhodospirillaceae bacterium]|nr:hypothetical protein [Rhodospirillaceae bacterium]
MNYQGGRISVQTPNMRAPFGVNVFTDDTNGKESHSISLNFPEDGEFEAKIRQMDEFVLKTALDNCEDWFGKTMSEEVIKEFYRPTITKDKTGKYPSTYRVKIPFSRGECVPEIYTMDREQVDISAITNGSYVTLIVDFQSIWFVGKQFGCSWRMQQARVQPSGKLKGYSFADDPEAMEDSE